MSEYQGRFIDPLYLSALLIFTFLSFIFLKSIDFLIGKFGFGVLALIIPTLFLTLVFWLNFLFKKIVVDENGIIIRRTLKLNLPYIYDLDLLYTYDAIDKIIIKGNLVYIKGKSVFTPGLLLIQHPEKFAKAIRKFCPEKLR